MTSALQGGMRKTIAHAFYDVALTVSVYLMGRSAGFNRKISLLGAFLLAALTLPLFRPVSHLDAISALSPNFVLVIAIFTIIVALFWKVDGRSWTKTTGISIVIILLLLSVSWSFIFFISMPVMVVAVMGAASLFAEKERSAIYAKLVAGGVIVAVLIAAGIPNYLYDLSSSMAQQYFPELEGQGPVVNRSFPAIGPIFTFWIPHILIAQGSTQWIMTVGIVGAVVAGLTSNDRRLRVFAFGYLALVAFNIVASIVGYVFWPWLTGQIYRGPTLYRMVHFISPFGILFGSFLVFAAAQPIVGGLAMAARFLWSLAQGSGKATPNDGRLMLRPLHMISYLLPLAGLAVPAALAAVDNPGFHAKRCPWPFFSPLESNRIIDYLVPRVALDLGKTFNGSVATLTGVRTKNYVWVDNITTDWQLWYRTGNEMHTIGLWQYRIPTLYQANITMTPQYFLTVAEFLSEATDKQIRTFIGITQPNERMMSLWGVRFLITDRPLSFGVQRQEIPIEVTAPFFGKFWVPPLHGSPIRLYELAEPNLGNYSPIEIVRATDAKGTIAAMKRSEFDGKRMVVTDADLRGNFTAARDTSITLIDGGFSIEATSDRDSILVLPVQYSHCWVADVQHPAPPPPMFFRANMMQLGIRFSGHLSAGVKYRFGPFWNSHCRLEDGRDVERLNMVAARTQS
jgi:hypothetical protein